MAAGVGQFTAIQAAALPFGTEVRALGMSDSEELERAIAAFSPGSNDGLIVTATRLGGDPA
jgi:hypothetical protein